MAIEVKITIRFTSDFHIGTGAGRGRATDAVVLTDDRGVPFIPGSTIKGVCKWQVCRLLDAYPHLGSKPDEKSVALGNSHSPSFEIFGGGTDTPYAENRVCFDHAYAEGALKVALKRSGRSARDRRTGRANDGQLYFYEDAGPAAFATTLRCDDNLSSPAILLFLLSLRRIDAIGGQRRRGKGRCECSLKVTVCDNHPELVDVELPAKTESDKKQFSDFAEPLLAALSKPAETLTRGTANRAVAVLRDTGKSGVNTPPAATQAKQVCWLVFAVAETPLTLGHEQAVDNSVATEDFISGSSLRGALAWQAIREGLSPNESIFQDIFVREKVHFGPLYPAASAWTTVGMSLPIPIPASFITCKRYPGSLQSSAETKVHGIADQLHGPKDQCDVCQQATKPVAGYVQLTGDCENASLDLQSPRFRVFQRSAIEEATQRGAEGQLFGLESIERGTRFGGYLWGDEDLLNAAFSNRKDKWTTIRIGKAKSRGQGLVSVRIVPVADADASEYPFLLSQLSQQPPGVPSNPAPPTPAHAPVYITLYSDLIAIESYLRPVSCLTADRLWILIGGKGEAPFELQSGYARTRRVGGFLGVVGVPRTPDIAIVAGSTWGFIWRINVTDRAINKARELLAKAQSSGVGLRRGEGFGRLIIDLPVHVAAFKDMDTVSTAVSYARIAFPQRFSTTQPTVDRSAYLENSLPPGEAQSGAESAMQRLFARIAQRDNPLQEVQNLIDNTLYRSDKPKALKQALLKLANDEGLDFIFDDKTQCIAAAASVDPNKIARFRYALKKYCGENISHV